MIDNEGKENQQEQGQVRLGATGSNFSPPNGNQVPYQEGPGARNAQGAANFDPGYYQTQPDYKPQKLPFRKPGLDLGTVLYPVLFGIFHLATIFIFQVGWLLFRSLTDPQIKAQFNILADRVAEKSNLIVELLMDDFVFTAIIYSLVQIVVYAIFLAYRNKKEVNYLLLKRPTGQGFLDTILVTFTSLSVAYLWMLLLNFLASQFDFWQETLESYSQNAELLANPNYLLMTLAVAVLVPIAEELLFRGIVINELRRVVSTKWAILISALLFAVFHMNLVQSVYVFFAGLALGLVYVSTQSLAMPIIMHMLYNFLGTVVPLMLKENETAQTIIVIVEGILGLIGIFSAVRLIRNTDKNLRKPWPKELLAPAGEPETQFMS